MAANLLVPGLGLCAPFAYVHDKTTNSVSVIDTANNTVVATQINTGITVNLPEARVYVLTSRNVSVVDTTTHAVVATIAPSSGYGIALNAAGRRVDATKELLNGVTVIDAATHANIADVMVAAALSVDGVVVNPSGTRVYVADAFGNVVIVLDTTSNPVAVAVGVGGSPYTVAQLTAPGSISPATTPDLNQHGLTGSWYEPATSGQGFGIEVFPDRSSGKGQALLTWFTFDSVLGGAERQRWYTVQGQVATGQSTASLTIYRNTGGNFNAPPATDAQAIGTATLSFDTCSSGRLSYTFTDGSGRAGAIPLTRLLPNVICSVTPSYSQDADFALSGSWYGGPATSGQGFMADVSPSAGAFFLSWFTYVPNGGNAGVAGQRWYTAQGDFAAGARVIPVKIYETTGGLFDARTSAGQKTVSVGTGTMAFQNCSAATFSYNFTGGSSNGRTGTIDLTRVGPAPPGCT
jgi:YVTN family beta-propeller protein